MLATQGATANPLFIGVSSALEDVSSTALEKQKETGASYLANYVQNIPKSAINGTIEAYLDGVSKAFRNKMGVPVNEASKNWFRNLLSEAGGEATEEVLQGLTDVINDMLNKNYTSQYLNEDGEFDWLNMLADLLKQGGYGFVGGLFGGGLSYSASINATAQRNQYIDNKIKIVINTKS